MQVGLKINLDSHHINHANSKLTITPNYPKFGIEVRYSNKIMKEFSNIYARMINHYKIKYQSVFSARFDKQDENNQVLDETELFITLNINHNLTESDFDEIDIKFPLEHQIQQQEMKNSGWRFDERNSITIFFFTKLVNWMVQNMLKFLWDQTLSWKLKIMINIVSYGQSWFFCILVIKIILTEFQIINIILMQ